MSYSDVSKQKEAQHDHYLKNRDRWSERQSKRRVEFRTIIQTAKNVPCMDCGVHYPYYVMDLDHRGDKSFTISRLGLISSATKLQNEISKCDVVCANCHRERTESRRRIVA